MKIGVFGDSFAEKNANNKIWWQYLKNTHNHDVDCYGESGSSILFSALKIQEHAAKYDLVIWALTSPGRYSTMHKNVMHHQCNDGVDGDLDLELKTKIQAWIDFKKYAFDLDQENFVSKSIVHYLMSQFNIMIVPCFQLPLEPVFNLYNLCEWETKFYFHNQSVLSIYLKYQDLRTGHITDVNQKILAELINNQLKPGVFQTDYNQFAVPIESFNNCFTKFDS